MNLKKNGVVLSSKSVGTGPSSYGKWIYHAAVSQRLRNTVPLLLKYKHIPLTCFHSSINAYRNHAKILWFVTNLYLGCNGHLTSTTNQGKGIKFWYRSVDEPRVCSDRILFRVMACRGCMLVVFTFLYCMPQKIWECHAQLNQLTVYWELCLYSGNK